MKLVVAARHEIMALVNGHVQARQHLKRGQSAFGLTDEQLLKVAKSLDIDVKAIVKHVRKHGRGPEALYCDYELVEAIRHANAWPGFSGSYEFRLSMVLLGKRVTRTARAEYSHTPEWEYYDVKLQKLMQAPYQSRIALSVRVDDEQKRKTPIKGKKRLKAKWERIDLSAFGVIGDEIWQLLRAKIDERCKMEDERRRAVASRGKRVTGPPPAILEFSEVEEPVFREIPRPPWGRPAA
jgi:hypothetical protein